jgi:tetratricopeptide (TPR) repeat protein
VSSAPASRQLEDAHPHNQETSPWLLAAILVALTFVAYWPTFSNGFLNYDDDGYITQNHFVQQGLSLANVAWAFRATAMANWHPLTWISHMADVQFFGSHAAGHHATSLVIHAINVVLLFFLLRAATGFVWRSAAISALFALHPFNVECVAWVSERKTLLCTLFLFLSLFAYGWYVRKPGVGRYLTVVFLFALGLASKPMIVTLPFALLLLDYWPLGRLPVPSGPEGRKLFLSKFWPLVAEKLPLLLFSAASAYITVFAQGHSHAVASVVDMPLAARVSSALWSYLVYLVKSVWPVHLAIFYPHPENSLPIWKPALSIALLLLFTGYCLLRLQQRYLIAGWLWYLGSLVPVIGFVQVGRQAMADRYAYTPFLGIFVIVVWSLADHFPRIPHRFQVLAGLAGVFLIFFAGLTWRQTTYWKDSFSVFGHALQVVPVNYMAENNLGGAYADAGDTDTAYEHFLRATQERPRYGLAHYNLANMLRRQNHRAEAAAEFRIAVQYAQDPAQLANAFHNLGVVLIEDNKLTEARAAFTEALNVQPQKQNSYVARGLAEFRLGDYAAAEADFVAGTSLSPDGAAWYWLGRSREARGNINGAIEGYRNALVLQPELQEAKEHLDAALSGRGLLFLPKAN